MAKRHASATASNKSDVIREIIKQQPKATVKEIKSVLSRRGIKASDALVNKVKYARSGKKSKGARRAHGNNGATSKATAIRDAWRELGLSARPRDVVATLAQRGVTVSSAQVSTLRKSLPKNGRSADAVPFEHLLAAKSLAERLGGIEAAHAALASLARLVN